MPDGYSFEIASSKKSGICSVRAEQGLWRLAGDSETIRVLADADAESNDLIRVIDESGEDYVYPARLFQRLTLPTEVQRALRLAS